MLVDWISKLVFPTVNKVSKHYLSLCSALTFLLTFISPSHDNTV